MSVIPRRPFRTTAFGLVGLVLVFGATTSCAKRGPRDVDNRNPKSEFADGPRGSRLERDGGDEGPTERVVARPTVGGTVPHEIARASARAIVTSPSFVYFGDDAGDELFALAKPGGSPPWGQPQRLARRSPTPGALAIDTDNASIAWIATPGDVVFRIGWRGGAPTTIRENALFTDLAIQGGEVFLTEAKNGKGLLTRVTGTTATVIAETEGSPRGIAVDAEHVFVASTTRLSRTLRHPSEVTGLATGSGFANPVVDQMFLYATAVDPSSRARRIVRVKKTGGELETIATGVRDAPIALFKGNLYWFDGEQPALVSAPVTGSTVPPPRVVSEDPRFDRPRALTVDDDGAFVAAGEADGARILLVPARTTAH